MGNTIRFYLLASLVTDAILSANDLFALMLTRLSFLIFQIKAKLLLFYVLQNGHWRSFCMSKNHVQLHTPPPPPISGENMFAQVLLMITIAACLFVSINDIGTYWLQ